MYEVKNSTGYFEVSVKLWIRDWVDTHQDLFVASILRGILEIHANKMSSQSPIILLVNSIQYEIYKVESRQKGRWQVNVLRYR